MADNPFDLYAPGGQRGRKGGPGPGPSTRSGSGSGSGSAWRGGAPHLSAAPPHRAASKGAARTPPTEEALREKLKTYVKVAERLWPDVRFGTYVRYIGRDGELRNGGFVVKNPFDTKPRGSAAEKRFMKLQNSFDKTSPRYSSWVVAYEDIEFLYAKADAVEQTTRDDLRDTIDTLNRNIRTLASRAKKQDGRLTRLEGRDR